MLGIQNTRLCYHIKRITSRVRLATHQMEMVVQMFRFSYTIASNNDIKEVRNELATEHSANSPDQHENILWHCENCNSISEYD